MRNFLLYCIGLIVCLSSCKTLKETQQEVELFQPRLDSTSKIVYKDLIIQPLDQLKIQVFTEATGNQEQALIFNLPGNGINSVNTNTSNLGNGAYYEVDKDSTIVYPKLGKIKVAGLSSRQLRDTLTMLLNPYIKDVRIVANISTVPIYSFTSSGSSKIIFNEEKVTLLDFMARSGTAFGGNRLDNILVVREDSGTRHYYEVDVRSPKSLYGSPVYQLQQNDLVYVHPTKTRLRQLRNADNTTTVSTFTFFSGLFSSAISLVLIIITVNNLFK